MEQSTTNDLEFTPPPRSHGKIAPVISCTSNNAMDNNGADDFVADTASNALCGLDLTPPPQRQPRNRQNLKTNRSKFVSSPGLMVSEPIEVTADKPINLQFDEIHRPACTLTPSASNIPTRAPPTPSTPSDIASSKWRTLRCPMAPCPRRTDRDESISSSPCSGLLTPNNVWNASDTPGIETPHSLHDARVRDGAATLPYASAGDNFSDTRIQDYQQVQFGVSPTALSLALASAKLGATLPSQEEHSVNRVRNGLWRRSMTLEPCVETGLTMDSLPDLHAQDDADGALSEASLSPRSMGLDGSDC